MTYNKAILAIITIVSILHSTLSLNSDGTYLLSLKYSILSDPLSVLNTWDYLDLNPCSWTGVTCTPELAVIGLALPNSQLLGSIPTDLSLIPTLESLDLSGNFFNGTLPTTLFNSTSLKVLSLSSNVITGNLPDLFSHTSLTFLNLSDNAIGGHIPTSLTTSNLTVLSLKGNYISGNLPGGFNSLEILDLSSNLFNGTLPENLGGSHLTYLNLSFNRFSGEIPSQFATTVPENATIDLSFNNLTGQIPAQKPLLAQRPELYNGNQDLCGKPLKNLCVIPSSLSAPPNVTTSSISPAIAVIPKTVGENGKASTTSSGGSHNDGLKPVTIVGITLADLAGIGVLGAVFIYLYQRRNKKIKDNENESDPDGKKGDPAVKICQMGGKDGNIGKGQFLVNISPVSSEELGRNYFKYNKCLTKCLRGRDGSEEGTSSEARTSSDSEDDGGDEDAGKGNVGRGESGVGGGGKGTGTLVMVDGETELEVETLLKASAYILGASGSSIVYKAVLHDGIGSTFAVRRLGEIWVERMRDFEGHVRTIAKIRHPNLVKLRGFYWGSDEKLVIYDYISNGSLATSGYKKNGSTPYHLPLLVRLRIARGLARGLAYIHEKRFVHGNIKPTNVLLTQDMDPVISDLGLSWLVYGNSSGKGGGSARQFGSKRSMGSYDGTQELSVSGSPYINPFGSANGVGSPYQAPESLKNLKPNPKWDVYSFGIVLLELLTGKVYLDRELGQWTPSSGLEDRYWVLRIADVALRAEIQGKEEAMMSIFKLGFSCASLVPQKRPSMKDAVQVLEKVPLSFVQ